MASVFTSEEAEDFEEMSTKRQNLYSNPTLTPRPAENASNFVFDETGPVVQG